MIIDSSRALDLWKQVIVLFLLTVVFKSVNATSKESGNDLDWMDDLIPDNYSSRTPPSANGKDHTVVSFRIRPHFVTAISMKTMDFDVDLQISVSWEDHRLQYQGKEHLMNGFIHLPDDVSDRIWHPRLNYENVKGSKSRLVTPEAIRIGPGYKRDKQGRNIIILITEERSTKRFTCILNFTSYPFDVQHCSIDLNWEFKKAAPVKVELRMRHHLERILIPPGFKLKAFVAKDKGCVNGPYKDILCYTSLTFVFKREYDQDLMLVFLPSVLIVVLSWVSFWLDVETAAPRVALGLTTLLTLSTQFNAAQRNLPPVAYIKALDVWMFACIFTVFASLIEFAIANVCRRLYPVNKEKGNAVPVGHYIKPANRYAYSVVGDIKQVMDPASGRKRSRASKCASFCKKCCLVLRKRHTTSLIDYVARIVFPLCFIIFNLIFWNDYVWNRHTVD